MAISAKTFLIELYEEYLEEASFLYEQRLSLLVNPEIRWKKIGEFEERFEAHIDGLVVGGDLAIEVCKRRAEEGDFGELHAAVRVFCRQNRKDLVVTLLENVDTEDDQKVKAIADALKHELPAEWNEDIFLFARVNPRVAPLLAIVVGYSRAQIGETLDVLCESQQRSMVEIIWAYGRLGKPEAFPKLRKYLDSHDPVVQSIAATALLRLGDEFALSRGLKEIRLSTWPLVPVALAGSRAAVRLLMEMAGECVATEDWLTAIGLLGDISAIPVLLDHLSNPKIAGAAALSLYLITGAYFSETVFVPEEVDEDELFDDERENLRSGIAPLRSDGRPFGTNVTQISQERQGWQTWWAENESGFEPGVRYRLGKLYSPGSLVEILGSDQSPHLVRTLAYEELVVRYGTDVPFEVDMFLVSQQNAIERMKDWVQQNGHRFREGAYYFGGRLMPL